MVILLPLDRHVNCFLVMNIVALARLDSGVGWQRLTCSAL